MIILYVVLGAVALILLFAVGTYNALVRLRQHVRESWSAIDTELKRRYDLIPNLVETVKGYATHERETLDAVIQARTRAVASTGSPGEQAAAENPLGHTDRLFELLRSESPALPNEDVSIVELNRVLRHPEQELHRSLMQDIVGPTLLLSLHVECSTEL